MYRILVNTSLTYYQKLKKKGSRQTILDDEILEIIPQLQENEHEKSIVHEYVVSVLVRMPAQLARILRMHFLDDKSQREIANDLGITETAVKARVHRSKKEFKKVKAELESRVDAGFQHKQGVQGIQPI